MDKRKFLSRLFLVISLALFLSFNLFITNHVKLLLDVFVENKRAVAELFIYPPKLFVTTPTLDNFKDLSNLLSDSLIPFSRYLFNIVIRFVSSFIVLGRTFIFILSLAFLVVHICLELKTKKSNKVLISIGIVLTALVLIFANRIVISILGNTNLFKTLISLIIKGTHLLLSLFESFLINLIIIILLLVIMIISFVKAKGIKKLFSLIFPATYLIITIPAFIINLLTSIIYIILFVIMFYLYGFTFLTYIPFP